MKGFNNRPQVVVTLTRGDDLLELTLHTLPPGWATMVRSAFKPPIENNSGKITYRRDDPEWNDLYGLLVIGKALEPSGVLDTVVAGPRWEKVAHQLRDEFTAAGLTDGDLVKLAKALGDLNNVSEVRELRGN